MSPDLIVIGSLVLQDTTQPPLGLPKDCRANIERVRYRDQQGYVCRILIQHYSARWWRPFVAHRDRARHGEPAERRSCFAESILLTSFWAMVVMAVFTRRIIGRMPIIN